MTWWMLAVGCGPEPAPEPVRPLCSTPVELAVPETLVEPGEVLALTASGGTGHYLWHLGDSGSGASLEAHTGVYASGLQAGVDVVFVADRECSGAARAEITVVSPVSLLPEAVEVRPGMQVAFEVVGGSRSHSCELLQGSSGGSVSAECVYEAGPTEGQDRIRVVDAVTGSAAEAKITVDPLSRLRIAGEGRFFLPLGSIARPQSFGGSGHLELSGGSASVELQDGRLVGAQAGTGDVRITDRFTGDSIDVPVEVVAPFTPVMPRDGERSGEGQAIPLGDVNGDGYPDVAFGFIEPSLGAYYSGMVLIYAGGPSGLEPDPVRVISGASEMDTLGRSIAAGDVDGDGLVDLVVGVDKADRGGTNTGSLLLYRGAAGSYFEPEPFRLLHGEEAYARVGSSLALCDFDGDGWLDLAAGALDGVDPNAAVPANDQGAVYVWRGSALGYADRAEFALFGRLPDEAGDWVDAKGIHLGESLAAADFDGDGLCDLAVSAAHASLDGRGSDGAVFVYRGTLDQGLVLTRDPARFYAAVDSHSAEFGRRLAAKDVDGDGEAELAIAAWRADHNGSSSGAVYLFAGGLQDGRPSTDPVLAEEAAWRIFGSPSTNLGSDVDLADVSADGVPDLIAGAYRADTAGGTTSGSAVVYDGASLVQGMASAPHDASGESPAAVVSGPSAYGRLGQVARAVGDVNDDGTHELFLFAGNDDAYGVDVGAPYVASFGATDLDRLELPGTLAGHEFGSGVTLFDADGDGCDDLWVGGPGSGDPEIGANSGSVHLYACEGDGFSDHGQLVLGSHAHHSFSDRFGHDLASAGDFDGDGFSDLVVVARKDSRPSSFDDDVVNPEDCPGLRSQAGAAFVYRGGPDGLESRPSFAVYGLGSYDFVTLARGGFDRNGDGFDDLVLASPNWGIGGGVAFAYGRGADPDGTTVICDTERYFGDSRFDRVGDAVAAVGDLDGDGCDEVAVGATGDEHHPDWYNQGLLRVLWGLGAPGCPEVAQVSTLALNARHLGLGSGIAGGEDVDGGGTPDLVVGGFAYVQDFAEVGAAFLVPGERLVGLSRHPASESFATPGSTWEYLLAPSGLSGRHGLVGSQAASQFGEEVALVRDPEGGWLVAVSQPQGSVSSSALGGGVTLHRFTPGPGLDPVPWAVLAGESTPGSKLGQTLVTGRDGSILLVGAPASTQRGSPQGAAYVLRFE